MLILSIFDSYKKAFEYGFIGLCTVIDGIAYRLVSLFFKLFYALAENQLLDSSIYRAIESRVYLFIGVIALFTLSVSLLKALVNPDEINKGVIKSFKSLITSIILVILTPTIFTYAFSIQSAIFSDNIIGRIFQIDLNDYKETGETKIVNSESSMSQVCNFDSESVKTITVYSSSGESNPSIEITKNECQGNYITMTILEAFFTPENSSTLTNKYGTTWADAKAYMIYTGDFNYLSTFTKNTFDETGDQSVSYMFIISTIAAGFLIYLLLSFCIDLGVRAAKLAFYQLIAPFPILMKMIPGKEGQFDKWVKSTVSTFLEVFVRLIVIEFVVFMCSNLFSIIDSMNGFSSVGLLGKAILALGLLAFAKQVPKLLADVLGIDSGNLKLGIKGKLTDVPIAGKAFAGAYNTANKFKGAATGALGAGYSSLVNGGKFGAGAKYGAASGWKSGGSQFNTQRQGIYKEMGYKGKAGWLGGQAVMDKKLDDYRNSYTDYYKDNVLKEKINKYESSEPWVTQYNSEYDDLKASHEAKLKNAQDSYNSLNSALNNEINSIEQEINSKAKSINTAGISPEQWDKEVAKLDELKRNMINEAKQKYTPKIAELNNLIADEKDYLFNPEGAVRKVINDKGKAEEIKISRLEKDARKATIGTMGDKDPTYKNDIKVYNSRINEKEVTDYKNSPEGQKAVAAYEEAFNKVYNKNNKQSEGASAPKGDKK
jgi:hypothetical protein